ncbi:TRAP transporter fused permease subunit, partial [Candidatus Poribacteria bacterium]|nr:TRAP transporter fused permease subunit [Candidatus Poribacteria bacterium]
MNTLQRFRRTLFQVLAAILSLFILVEVNYPRLTPQSQVAIFAMLGLILVFLKYPIHRRLEHKVTFRVLDLIFAIVVVVCFGYVLIQTEPVFKRFWLGGQSLGNRAGMERYWDYIMGLAGVLLVLEATRRAIGTTLPLLSLAFLFYAAFGQSMPNWLFPHRGYSWERIVSQTFLHSQGVFGIALNVMFTYVFLFVLFGVMLEKTGATGYIINFAKRLFRSSAGGPAKVAVISSGMMGSLSGSAVANVATVGTFTIPMMKSTGFKPAVAGGIEAAASSGGALVPPIMGAGAYMMLEIVNPPVTYLQIIKAAVIPSILYYTTLFLIVHFRAKLVEAREKAAGEQTIETPPKGPVERNASEPAQSGRTPDSSGRMEGLIFFTALSTLILFLILGYTPFRAVSLSLLLVLVLSAFNKRTRLGIRDIFDAMAQSGHGGVSLIAAASCVGLILGVVTLTGIGSKLPGALLPLAHNNLILALVLLMISTIILGMGLPSSVCYLLMATLVGPVLGDFGTVPLAAHFFIFYFGMMSMVTPPVALAAYTAAAI